MKLIGNFDTHNPERLTEQLDRLQANVNAETKAIRAAFMLDPQPLYLNGSSPLPALGVGQIAIVDTTLGDVRIPLIAPAATGFVAIVKRIPANNVIVAPTGSNGPAPILVNLAPTKTYAAMGLYWLFFDGQNWIG